MDKGWLKGTTALVNSATFASPFQKNYQKVTKALIMPRSSTLEIELGHSERGVIISNPMKLDGTSAHIESSDIDPSELRRALLFWDRIVWPSTNGIYIAGGPDIEYLVSQGKIFRPHFSVNGDVALALCEAFAETYRILERKNSGQWIMSQGERSLRVVGNDFVENRGVVSRLINAIPVPDRTVPLEDVILFREKRSDEVIALRTVVEDFYQQWVNSEDQDHQFKLAISRIDAEAASMIRVAKESQIPFKMSSWKISFNATPDIAKLVSMFFGGVGAFDLSLVQSILVAGPMSTISIGPDLGYRSAIKQSPYSYVASLEKELM